MFIFSSRVEEEKKELVIPLISQNRWKTPRKPDELESTENNVDGEPEAKRRKTAETEEARSNGDIEASAINELLQGLYATCTCL